MDVIRTLDSCGLNERAYHTPVLGGGKTEKLTLDDDFFFFFFFTRSMCMF